MKKYVFLAFIGLMINSCSKNAPVTLKHPTPGPYDFRYGNFGQTRVAVNETESAMGNGHGIIDYDVQNKTTIVTYTNADKSTDAYTFDSSSHMIEGGHTSAVYTDRNQLSANYNSQVGFYSAIYGKGKKDPDMYETWTTIHGIVQLGVGEIPNSPGNYVFYVAYLPLTVKSH